MTTTNINDISYLNEVIHEHKDTLSDTGMNLLFHKLITNLKIVSLK